MDFLYKVIALTRYRPTQEQLLEAFLRFKSGLRVSLIEPGQNTSIRNFIDQLDSKKTAWFENYTNYSKRPYTNTLTQSGNQHQTHKNHRNQRFGPQQQDQARQNQNSFRNRGAALGQGNRYTTSTPAAITGPTPGVYHSDTLPITPATRPIADSTSHTPRRFGNTHNADSEDKELGVYYNGTRYGCNVDGYTHRHDALP